MQSSLLRHEHAGALTYTAPDVVGLLANSGTSGSRLIDVVGSVDEAPNAGSTGYAVCDEGFTGDGKQIQRSREVGLGKQFKREASLGWFGQANSRRLNFFG